MNEQIEKAKMWISENKPIAIALGVIGGGYLLWKMKKKSDLSAKRRRAAAKARRAKAKKRRR